MILPYSEVLIIISLKTLSTEVYKIGTVVDLLSSLKNVTKLFEKLGGV